MTKHRIRRRLAARRRPARGTAVAAWIAAMALLGTMLLAACDFPVAGVGAASWLPAEPVAPHRDPSPRTGT
jgi:predicted nucleic acid-binding protein